MKRLLLCLLLTGCAMNSNQFFKGDGTDEQRERDFAGCRAFSSPMTMNGVAGMSMGRQMLADCMRSKGWIRQ